LFYGPLNFVQDYLGELLPEPIWILLEQETVSGSGISWAIYKSAPRRRQLTTPAPHHSDFTGQMPFLPPNQQLTACNLSLSQFEQLLVTDFQQARLIHCIYLLSCYVFDWTHKSIEYVKIVL